MKLVKILRVQKVISQRSAGACTRCTRSNAFPGSCLVIVSSTRKTGVDGSTKTSLTVHTVRATLIVCIWRLLETKAGIEELAFLRESLESKVIKYLIAYHLSYVCTLVVCIWRLLETKAGIEGLAFLRGGLESKVMKIGSNTFCNPFFQMVLQNQQSRDGETWFPKGGHTTI